MKIPTLYKFVQYGYPSSDMAKEFGLAKEGVWFVTVSKSNGMNEGLPIAGFASESEAIAFASKIKAHWHLYTLRK